MKNHFLLILTASLISIASQAEEGSGASGLTPIQKGALVGVGTVAINSLSTEIYSHTIQNLGRGRVLVAASNVIHGACMIAAAAVAGATEENEDNAFKAKIRKRSLVSGLMAAGGAFVSPMIPYAVPRTLEKIRTLVGNDRFLTGKAEVAVLVAAPCISGISQGCVLGTLVNSEKLKKSESKTAGSVHSFGDPHVNPRIRAN